MVIVLLKNSTCYYWDNHLLVKNTVTHFALFFDTQEQTTYFGQFCLEKFSFNSKKTDTLPLNNVDFESVLMLLGQKWNSLVGFSLV